MAFAGGAVRAQEAWPAEAITEALNLTAVEGAEPNDFYSDLSGASWNAVTRRLWVCRNGPGGDQSKFWALREDGSGTFVVDERDGRRAEWTGFGDLESITQADLARDVVYLLVEGEESVKAFDVSTYGTAVPGVVWNLRAYLPLNAGSGAEGLTFVPDAALSAAGFVDRNGAPTTSRRGMGGLMFVGHQNGGALFVFDLDPAGGFDFVGEYRTSSAETAGLEFDRSTGVLWIWHDDVDTLEKASLRSSPVSGQTYRRIETLSVFSGPSRENNEGIAVFGVEDCRNGVRDFFMTVDGGGSRSLLDYRRFTDGCPATDPPPAPPLNVRRTDRR